jgi:hypothetical protein
MPFSSAGPINVATTAGGAPSSVAIVGVSSGQSGVVPGGGSSVTFNPATMNDTAYIAAASGTLSRLFAQLSATSALSLAGTATVSIQVYEALPGSNVFNPLPNSSLSFVPFSNISIGNVLTASNTNVSAAITQGRSYFVVASMTTVNQLVITTLSAQLRGGMLLAALS